MGSPGSGRPPVKSGPNRGSSGAGTIRCETSSTGSRNGNRPRDATCSRRSSTPPSRAEALAARRAFEKRFEPWYPKAVEILANDWDRMVTFYDFPEPHWKHLRTTNVVASPFASVRLRTTAAKRFKRVDSATTLIWKLLTVAEKRFRKINAPHLLRQVADGHVFRDGKPVHSAHGRVAA